MYTQFFDKAARLGMVVTPDDKAWRACGNLLSRYKERYGSIQARDHQNDVLIALTARELARREETTIVTANDAHFATWLSLVHDRANLHIQPVRR